MAKLVPYGELKVNTICYGPDGRTVRITGKDTSDTDVPLVMFTIAEYTDDSDDDKEPGYWLDFTEEEKEKWEKAFYDAHPECGTVQTVPYGLHGNNFYRSYKPSAEQIVQNATARAAAGYVTPGVLPPLLKSLLRDI